MARRASKKRGDRRDRGGAISRSLMRQIAAGRLLVPVLGIVLVALWWIFGQGVRHQLGLGGTSSSGARPEAALRVATWNLRNFPEADENLELLKGRLQEIDAQVWVFQEVASPAALELFLRDALPSFELVTSEQGGAGRQHLAIAWDSHRVRALEGAQEHRGLTMGGRVRPGLSVHLRAIGSELDFQVMGVHLKAMPDGYDLRRQQSTVLLEVAQALLEVDRQLLIVGDFNVTGAKGEPAEQEASVLLDELDEILIAARHQEACTAYWDGERRDAWKEPSTLDWIFVAGLEPWLGSEPVARVGAHCAAHRCEPLRSTAAYPEPDLEGISDHCPVFVDLDLAAAAANSGL